MFILEAHNIKKWFGDRLLFSIDNLQISPGEKIGVVGRNSAGKTTFLRMLGYEETTDEGDLRVNGTIAWIKQDPDIASSLSGGEETKHKITKALSAHPSLLLADEPTSHLDIEGVQWLEKQLVRYSGSVLLISHDRELLNNVCTRILEIDGEKSRVYNGNYESFLVQKKQAKKRAQFEYEQVEREKSRLLEAARKKEAKASKMNKPPNRMGTSESRLYKAGKGSQIAKVAKQATALETRITQLEQKEKTVELPSIQLDLKHHQPLASKTALRLENISKKVGSRVLLHNFTCSIPTGAKVALIGKNGTGKSTLLKLIAADEEGIKCSPQAKLGFFDQKLGSLNPTQTILENVSNKSGYPESLIRTILARLYFSEQTIFKKVSTLSGGEKVKVLLAEIFLSDANVLLLDEPTNFLDIPTREELESVLSSYPGTILFASHDRKLISTVATHLIVFEEGYLRFFPGTYKEYIEKPNSKPYEQDHLLLLQHELTEVISRLSLPLMKDEEKKTLESHYQQLLENIKQLKKENKL